MNGSWQRVRKDYGPVRRELRRLAQAWSDSGPNVEKLFSADHVLAQAALQCRAHVIPTKTNRARLICVTVPEDLPPGDTLEIAFGIFLNFLINPDNEKLGGPCRNCDKYYVKNTKRQMVYCCKRCGLKHTSRIAVQKKRQKERLEKLREARKSAAKWKITRTRLSWKEWVCSATTISKKFLTEAVKKGELVEPVKKPAKIR